MSNEIISLTIALLPVLEDRQRNWASDYVYQQLRQIFDCETRKRQ